MHAREVDQADARLRELREEERGDVALGTATLAASVVAAAAAPEIAAPLFVGGLAVLFLGARAMWRRWDLLERLSGQPDAHLISEVRGFAAREATMERRRSFAALLRAATREAALAGDVRVLAVASELEALASELDDGELEIEPAAAVACSRLLSDVAESPLLNRAWAIEDLRSRVRQVRAGLRPRRG